VLLADLKLTCSDFRGLALLGRVLNMERNVLGGWWTSDRSTRFGEICSCFFSAYCIELHCNRIMSNLGAAVLSICLGLFFLSVYDLGLYNLQLMCNYYTVRQDGSATFMRSWVLEVINL
jgi:hypothetical protein